MASLASSGFLITFGGGSTAATAAALPIAAGAVGLGLLALAVGSRRHRSKSPSHSSGYGRSPDTEQSSTYAQAPGAGQNSSYIQSAKEEESSSYSQVPVTEDSSVFSQIQKLVQETTGFSRRSQGKKRKVFSRQKRRAPPNTKSNSKKDAEEKVLQRVLNLIRQQDVTGCGMKLVCELAGLREKDLNEEQRAILSLVDQVPSDGTGGINDYKIAMAIGSSGWSCEKYFSLCALTGTDLIRTIDYFLP